MVGTHNADTELSHAAVQVQAVGDEQEEDLEPRKLLGIHSEDGDVRGEIAGLH